MNHVIKEKLVGGTVILMALLLLISSLIKNVPYEQQYDLPVIPERSSELSIEAQLAQLKQVAVGSNNEKYGINSNTREEIDRQVLTDRSIYAQLDEVSVDKAVEEQSDSVELIDESVVEIAKQKQHLAEGQLAAVEATAPKRAEPQDKHIDSLLSKTEVLSPRNPSLGEPLQPLKPDQKLADRREFSDALKPAWQVQVASFKESANAERLNAELILKGFRAYRTKVAMDSGEIYRVFVGPEILKSRAETVASTLQQTLGTQVMVVRYVP